jgi:ribosome-binding protein aMBF1 (putative translation factor)
MVLEKGRFKGVEFKDTPEWFQNGKKEPKTALKEALGVQIQSLRVAAGLTQRQLAAKIGTSDTNISLWERGVTMPDSRYLEKICGEFGVELRFVDSKS